MQLRVDRDVRFVVPYMVYNALRALAPIDQDIMWIVLPETLSPIETVLEMPSPTLRETIAKTDVTLAPEGGLRLLARSVPRSKRLPAVF